MQHRDRTWLNLKKQLLWLALLALIAAPSAAQESTRLVIGTKEAAPFSFKGADGQWRGISIDLWRGIAEKLGLEYEFKETSLMNLIQGLENGQLDASVAALTVTSAREQVIDFTHAFHPSGLGIAVPIDGSRSMVAILMSFFSVRFFQAVGTLLVVLFFGAMLLWLLERKKNAEQFGGSLAKGLGTAFWWSAVTMTTVGYGDKAPTTLAGRAVAVIWMFASIIMISGLTAAIASTLTVSKLEHTVSGPQDLPSIGQLGCVEGSTGEAYLRQRRLPFTAFPNAEAALLSLGKQETQAVVYDAPILRYLTLTKFAKSVTVLPVTFERQDYAIALPLESPLRKSINKAMLERVSSEEWSDVLYKYLGTTQ